MSVRFLAFRDHAQYWAFLLHRLSGLALVLFLPVHFYVLGTAISDDASFSGFIEWSDRTAVKLAEMILFGLLVLHLAGGLRILVIEFHDASARDARWVRLAMMAGATGAALFAFVALVLGAS